MNRSLFTLVKQSKTDNNSLENVIDLFSPKIHRSLQQTKKQFREDLSQELKIKIVNCTRKYDVDKTPGYFQMIDLLERKGIQNYEEGNKEL